jgi:pimeloyl-ACP methyl ester carboxylesterase
MADTETVAAAPRFRVLGLSAAATFVGAGSAGLFLWRTFTWPSASSNDAWAYEAWGQALARGQQIAFHGATTPKPLAAVLGAVVAPLPPERGMAIVVALAMGALAASLFAAAYRELGAAPAAVSVVAFAVSARIDEVIWFSLIDAVTAALIVLGLALRGWSRIASFVLAGLLRPEAWLVSFAAGYFEGSGSRRRRLALAVGAGLAPILLWLVIELLVSGDALSTFHFTRTAEAEEGGVAGKGLEKAISLFFRQLRVEGGLVLIILGVVGIVVHTWRRRRRREFDPMPLAALTLFSLGLVIETVRGFELNARYFLPVVAILALGCGLLVGSVVPACRKAVCVRGAALVAIAVLILVAVTMDFDRRAEFASRQNLSLERSVPLVDRALACGRLGVAGSARGTRVMIERLAAATRTPLSRFGRIPPDDARSFATVLSLPDPNRPKPPTTLGVRVPLGRLIVRSHCLSTP